MATESAGNQCSQEVDMDVGRKPLLGRHKARNRKRAHHAEVEEHRAATRIQASVRQKQAAERVDSMRSVRRAEIAYTFHILFFRAFRTGNSYMCTVRKRDKGRRQVILEF